MYIFIKQTTLINFKKKRKLRSLLCYVQQLWQNKKKKGEQKKNQGEYDEQALFIWTLACLRKLLTTEKLRPHPST